MSEGQDPNLSKDRRNSGERTAPALLIPLIALAVFVAAVSSGHAQSTQPVVVELFTSQGCSSCPPAEAYLGELAARPDIIALEWHVDYWDSLVYGLAGRWQDPFSDPAFTDRQTRYNLAIRDRARIYTPQMVIDGRWEAVGSRIGEVERLLTAAQEQTRLASIDVQIAPGDAVTVHVDGQPADAAQAGSAHAEPAGVWLVRFRDREATTVEGGENRGRVLVNHHVVIGIDRLGTWDGGAVTYSIPPGPLLSGESGNARCAVLVQTETQGPIAAAAYCPPPSG